MSTARARTAPHASWSDLLRSLIPKRRFWLFLATVPMGLAISIAFQTRAAPGITSEPSMRSVSTDTILRLEEEQRALKDNIRFLRLEMSQAQEEAAARRTTLSGLSSEIQSLKLAAGLSALKGPGVKVTLDDSQSRGVPLGTDPNQLIVHDYDLRDVVGILWASGAEAISINGQRLVGNTSIYCVGSTILVNDTRLSPPYVIESIGPIGMQAAMNEPAALERYKALVKRYGLGFTVVTGDEVLLPAFDGRLSSRTATTLKS